MKFTKMLVIIMVIMFVMINLPGVPMPIKIVTYTLSLATSIFSSSLAFYFFNSVPGAQYTLLTSSAKSVFGWHMINSGIIYNAFRGT